MADKIDVEFVDWKNVTDLLELMPDKTQKRIEKTALVDAARRLRTELRRSAPKQQGNLRKSILVKVHRNGSVTVGLKRRYYYKVLEFAYPSGYGAWAPWFEKAVEQGSKGVLSNMKRRARAEVIKEAGRTATYARAKGRR